MATTLKDFLESLPYPRNDFLDKEAKRYIRTLLREERDEEACVVAKKAYDGLDPFKRFVCEKFPQKDCPKITFRKTTKSQAGRAFQTGDLEKALRLLKEEYETTQGVVPNARPPAKGMVVAQSRPFDQWPVIKTAQLIQDKVFSSRRSDVQRWTSDLRNKTGDVTPPDKAWMTKWFEETGITPEFSNVQGLDIIFVNTFGIFDGVELKVQNRNTKNQAKAEKYHKPYEEEYAFTLFCPLEEVDGRLVPQTKPCDYGPHELALDGKLLHPPFGKNSKVKNLYCRQSFRVRPLDAKACMALGFKPGAGEVEVRGQKYQLLRPDQPIPTFGHKDRVRIPDGVPGHIPAKESRPAAETSPQAKEGGYLNPTKRIRRKFASEEERLYHSLLVVLQCGEDWALVDVRGLLRSSYLKQYRMKRPKTLSDLMQRFSKEPVVHLESGRVTFCYRQGEVPIFKAFEYKYAGTMEFFKRRKHPLALISIDLGVTNPVAAQVCVVEQGKRRGQSELLRLPEDILKGFQDYRTSYTTRILSLQTEARGMLSAEYQQALDSYDAKTPRVVARDLCEAKGLDYADLPWDHMTRRSTFINQALVEAGADPSVGVRQGRDGEFTATDYKWYCEFRPQAPKELRNAWNEQTWLLQCNSPDFEKLSKWKQELARRAVNWLVAEAKELTRLDTVAIAMEDLTLDNKFSSGSGKAAVGWDQFWTNKEENRWYMQALAKALAEQPGNHGIPLLIINKTWTSQTCPGCRDCGPGKRSKHDREKFVCECGFSGHADFEVAAYNIAEVALHGSLPGPKKSDEPKLPSRNTKKSNKIKVFAHSPKTPGEGLPRKSQRKPQSLSQTGV